MEKIINNRLIWYLEKHHLGLHNLWGQSFSFGALPPLPLAGYGPAYAEWLKRRISAEERSFWGQDDW